MAFDPETAAGIGMDDLEESVSMPIIRILQALSPEISKHQEAYIDGAEEGRMMLGSTKELLPEELSVVPVGGKSVYVEWIPKSKGGGLVATHPLTIVNHDDYKKGVKKKHDEWLGENELKYTRYWFILVEIEGEWQRCILAMNGSQLRIAREWSKEIGKFRYEGKKDLVPPIFAQRYTLSTDIEKNQADQAYFNFRVGKAEVLDFKKDEALLNEAHAASKDAALALPSPEVEPVKTITAGNGVEEEAF
jgi:hypothetical protein